MFLDQPPVHTRLSCHYLWGREKPTAFSPEHSSQKHQRCVPAHRLLELFWKLGLIVRRGPEPSEPSLGLVLSERSAGLGPREKRGPARETDKDSHCLSSWDHVGDPQETLMTRDAWDPELPWSVSCPLTRQPAGDGLWLDLHHPMSKETATTSRSFQVTQGSLLQ